MSSDAWGFETRQIHAGAEDPDPPHRPRNTPIYQTTSFVFEDSAHGARLFALQEGGNIYSRIMNPTQAVFEARMASLEGGIPTAAGGMVPGALAVGSGQAASTLAVLNLAESGDHVVSSPSLYGGSYNLLHYTMAKMGIEVTFVEDPDSIEQWRAATRPNTKAYYGETLPNPKNDVLDIEAIASLGNELGVPLIVDNTIATPYLCRPIEWGAHIVVHSATKFIGGHGSAIGGVIVDGGNFDFGKWADKFPNFNTPDPSYHGLNYWPMLGAGSYIVKARVQLLRDLGMATTPFNSWLFIQGVETLSLRMERHVSNAQKVAEFLESRDEVEKVLYAGLPSSPWYERAKKYTPKGAGSVLGFVIKGGAEAGQKFADALELHSNLANIGDVRSLVIHPGLHDPQPAHPGGDDGLRRRRRPVAPVGRYRIDRGHPRRSRIRLPGSQGLIGRLASGSLLGGGGPDRNRECFRFRLTLTVPSTSMSAAEVDAAPDPFADLEDAGFALLHERTYDVRSYRQSGTEIRIRGRVRDVKPPGTFLPDDPQPMTIHDMVLDLVVRMPELVITDATLVMQTHPHDHCTEIVEHYQNLIGLSIARGFTHRVRELFGGPKGCTHTTALIQAMAPVAIQSVWAMMTPAEGETPVALTAEDQRQRVSFNRNTCHVWAEDGPMFSILDRGELIPPPRWGVARMEELGMDIDEWYRRARD